MDVESTARTFCEAFGSGSPTLFSLFSPTATIIEHGPKSASLPFLNTFAPSAGSTTPYEGVLAYVSKAGPILKPLKVEWSEYVAKSSGGGGVVYAQGQASLKSVATENAFDESLVVRVEINAEGLVQKFDIWAVSYFCREYGHVTQ